jgi:hypothetical protein
VTPTDGSVTGDKLASTVTTSSNISLDGGTFVFNESGADKDFRIEGDTQANLFVADASTDRIGIGTSSPSHNLDVTSATASTDVSARIASTSNSGDNDGTLIIGNGGTGDAMIRFDYEGSNTDRARIGATASGQELRFFTAGDNLRMLIDNNGHITKPTQPMFSVRPTSAVTNVTGDGSLAYLGSSITATERFDVGSNVSGMLFTAPVTGKYLLCGQLIFSGLASNHTLTNFLLVTSNQTYYPFYGAEIDTVAYLGSHGSAFSIIADMDASDTAQLALQVYGGSAVVDASTSTFLTGMLLA